MDAALPVFHGLQAGYNPVGQDRNSITKTNRSGSAAGGTYGCPVLLFRGEMEKEVAGEKRPADLFYFPGMFPGLNGVGEINPEPLTFIVSPGNEFLARFGADYVPLFMVPVLTLSIHCKYINVGINLIGPGGRNRVRHGRQGNKHVNCKKPKADILSRLACEVICFD